MARDFEEIYAARQAEARARAGKALWDQLHPGPYVPPRIARAPASLRKEGRVISGSNRDTITKALDGIGGAMRAMRPHLLALADLMVATDPNAAADDVDDEDEGSE